MILEQRATYQGTERAICHHQRETILRRLAHLLWLLRFDLGRPYHLAWVRPLGLGVVAGGSATLGYSALEHFLGDLEALRVAAPLGDALARCYLEMWPTPPEGDFFYLDNRRKVRYSGYTIAAGKISASDRILGATTQLFIHDAAGHSLHMHNGPGDDHLSRTLLPFVQHFIGLVGQQRVRGIVADQEMRSVALFLALQAAHLGFITIGRTPTAKQEAEFAIVGLFLPYRRDAKSGEITHWIARAKTVLQDKPRGLYCETDVILLLDCRAGLPGRLVPFFYDLKDVPPALPVGVYVQRWESQERVFRDMRPCQNLDVCYGQKKVVVPNRVQERERTALQEKRQAQEKQADVAQGKVQEYAQRIAALDQEAQQKKADSCAQVKALRQDSRQDQEPQERDRLRCRADLEVAEQKVRQVRVREKRRRLVQEQRACQEQMQEHQKEQAKLAQALQELVERPLYDFDLEKDSLMTYLRMAGENAHRFVQEQYFPGTLLEKVDEATMVRVVYNQPGWVRRRGKSLYVVLQGYSDPKMQAAVAQACQRVSQARIQLLSGQYLRMEVAAKILDC